MYIDSVLLVIIVNLYTLIISEFLISCTSVEDETSFLNTFYLLSIKINVNIFVPTCSKSFVNLFYMNSGRNTNFEQLTDLECTSSTSQQMDVLNK